MFYLHERVAEARIADLHRDARRAHQARVFVGQQFRIRRHVGRFLIRIGNRLSGELQPEQQLAGAVGESG